MYEDLPAITASCSECAAESTLRPSAFRMTIFDSGRGSYYSFFCPSCTEESRRELDPALEVILCRFGVRLTLVHVPLEVLEPKGGPPISPEDVMDFVLDLELYSRTA